MWGSCVVYSSSSFSVLPICLPARLILRDRLLTETRQPNVNHTIERSYYRLRPHLRNLVAVGQPVVFPGKSGTPVVTFPTSDMGLESICIGCVREGPGLTSISGRAVPHGCVKIGGQP